MIQKLTLYNSVNFYLFTFFSEYFIGTCIIYGVIVIVLVTYNIYGLIVQKAFSECISLILLMAIYLIFNDDLSMFNFVNLNGSFINDYFAFFTKIIICFFSVLYFLVISSFLTKQKLIAFEYLLIFLFSILGLLIMCNSNDLLIAYLAIELSSLSFYVLAAFQKTSSYSIESGIKYFIVGAISSSFFLLGSSLIYGIVGSINFLDFQNLFNSFAGHFLPNDLFFNYWQVSLLNISKTSYIAIPNLNSNHFFNYNFIEAGLTLILFSLFIKLALVPFHLWSLDVYEGSPTNSTFFFAVLTKLSIFVLLIRICYQSFFCLKFCWQFYFFIISILSIFVASVGGLKQRKLKTLLAYSSIGHMGYVLLSICTSTFSGIQMLLFYLIIYMISGLVTWYIILLTNNMKKNKFKYSLELNDLLLLQKSNPALAFSLSLTMFSVAGIPPMAGFIAKMNVFLSVISVSLYFVAFLMIVCSVISTFYYIRVVKILYFENFIVGKLYYPIKNTKPIILSVLNFSILYFFFDPTVLYLINYKVILNLF